MTVPYRLVHRVAGVCLAIPLLLLVVTGIPLQFTVWLGLGSTGVPFSWVHDRYGIAVPQTMRAGGGVAQLGEMLFAGDRVAAVSGDLLGARELGPVVVAATPNELLLIMKEPDAPVERNQLPAVTRAFGIGRDQSFIVDTPGGRFVSEDFGASWSPVPDAHKMQPISWLKVETIAPGKEFASRFGAANLSWERWLQDLHSGRFFGPIGVWLMNLASFVFILLGFTGLVLWFTSRRVKGQR